MTREEFVEDIKISLGSPIVEVEVDQIIGKLVDKAFREVSRYVVETRFLTIPYSKTGIDLSEHDVDSVVQILRSTNPSRVADFTDIYSLSAINQNNSSHVNLLMSDYLYRTQLNQIKSTITTDMDFTYDPETKMLYVAAFYPKPLKITIVYIPKFKDVSEIKEMYWINYIQRLALAFTKEALGRVRGKYDLSSSLYKLDGDTLVNEGIAERDKVREELDANSDVVFPMD